MPIKRMCRKVQSERMRKATAVAMAFFYAMYDNQILPTVFFVVGINLGVVIIGTTGIIGTF